VLIFEKEQQKVVPVDGASAGIGSEEGWALA
jgi:NADP-dependent 3-hydroxy acid dehydrogenase YdfG